MCSVEGSSYVVLCIKTYSADRVKEDKADGACGIREGSRILVKNP